MNRTQGKCLLVMAPLVAIGFGPLSLTCLIGMSVVITRPRWFYVTVQNLYRDCDRAMGRRLPERTYTAGQSAAARFRCFLCLFALLLVDIAPVPVTGTLGLYVIIARPAWFKRLVDEIYGGDAFLTRDVEREHP